MDNNSGYLMEEDQHVDPVLVVVLALMIGWNIRITEIFAGLDPEFHSVPE